MNGVDGGGVDEVHVGLVADRVEAVRKVTGQRLAEQDGARACTRCSIYTYSFEY